MLKNILDAIRNGDWFFEPEDVDPQQYSATGAVPGTSEKLRILAERASTGLPLWHERDRADYEGLEMECNRGGGEG